MQYAIEACQGEKIGRFGKFSGCLPGLAAGLRELVDNFVDKGFPPRQKICP
jgi:hypothetical protein